MPNSLSFSNRFGFERAYLAEAIGSRFGSQLAIPAIFAFIIFSTGLLFSSAIFSPINPQIMDLSSGIAAFLVFWLAKKIKLEGRFTNLLIWLISGMFASLAPDIAILFLKGTLDEFLLLQAPVGVLAYSVNIAIIGSVWAGFRLSRERTKTLRSKLRELTSSQIELEAQIVAMNGEIRAQVESELAKVSEMLNRLSVSNQASFSDSVMVAIDQVIRPLSHRLAGFGLSKPAHVPASTEPPKQPRKGVSFSRLAGPEIYFVLVTFIIGNSALVLSGVSAAAWLCAVAALQTALLVVIERFAKKLYVHRGVGMLLHLLISASFGTIYDFLSPGSFAVGLATGFVTISIAVSGLLALISKRVDTLAELEFVRFQKAALVSRLSQEVWVTKTHLAKAIHGSVQAKFLAIALRLGSAASLTEQNLDQARLDLNEASVAVTASFDGDPDTLREQLNGYRDAWDGAVNIEFTIPKDVEKILDSEPITKACVVETIGEAIANAAKHSKAPEVSVAISHPTSAIEVSVSSQGALGAGSDKSGYGSQILDQVTNSWSLTENKGVVTLEANFQLAK